MNYIKIYPKVVLTGENPKNPLKLEPIKIELRSENSRENT